jgi:hypothetical protein
MAIKFPLMWNACYKTQENYAKISKFSSFKSQKKKGDEASQRFLWKT